MCVVGDDQPLDGDGEAAPRREDVGERLLKESPHRDTCDAQPCRTEVTVYGGVSDGIDACCDINNRGRDDNR